SSDRRSWVIWSGDPGSPSSTRSRAPRWTSTPRCPAGAGARSRVPTRAESRSREAELAATRGWSRGLRPRLETTRQYELGGAPAEKLPLHPAHPAGRPQELGRHLAIPNGRRRSGPPLAERPCPVVGRAGARRAIHVQLPTWTSSQPHRNRPDRPAPWKALRRAPKTRLGPAPNTERTRAG